jgi:hypothetical protein
MQRECELRGDSRECTAGTDELIARTAAWSKRYAAQCRVMIFVTLPTSFEHCQGKGVARDHASPSGMPPGMSCELR